MSTPRMTGITAMLLATSWLNLASPGLCQEPEELPAQDKGDWKSKFRIHAYLTLACGQIDGTPLLGLDEEGTCDHRTAALQFRFAFTERSELVLQLAHEALGDSPIDKLQDDVELDWLFYQHRFPSQTRLRAGRLPIPFGIYNEIRDVSTVLEFYRPPFSIYFEGSYSSESVDGVAVSQSFFASRSWNLSADVYYGSWDRSEYTASLPAPAEGEAKNGLGAQLWLNTPLSGLRFGLAAQRFDMEGGIPFFRTGDSDPFDVFLISMDADFARFLFRAEAQHLETRFPQGRDVEVDGFYLLSGYRVNDHLAFYLLHEDSKSRITGNSSIPTFKVDPYYRDLAAAVVYEFGPHVLLRLEAHRVNTVFVDVPMPPGEAARADFAILSLALSF